MAIQIIIYGSLDAIGQYVCFELAEKGFNIRILTNNRKAAINIFGLPGNNVDILELYPESSLDSYLKALDGAQAIIFCGNFEPKINLFLGECRAYNTVAMKLLDVAKAGKLSKTVSIQKVIQISRYTTSKFTPASITDFISRSDSVLCSEFRNLNLQLEDYIRGSTIEYAIVRAPSIVESAREGSRFDLRVYQESPETSSDLSLIGVLDLAECACQALLLDVVDKTFHIAEDGVAEGSSIDEDEPIITSAAMEEEFGVVERKKVISSRVPRKAYYSILDMDDTDMRSSYMIKAEEAYLAQIEEDRLLESYWKSQFSGLSPDSRA